MTPIVAGSSAGAVIDGRFLAEGREAEVFLQPDGTVLKLLRDPGAGDRVAREAAALTALAAGGRRRSPR